MPRPTRLPSTIVEVANPAISDRNALSVYVVAPLGDQFVIYVVR